jgi:hypothetical protein
VEYLKAAGSLKTQKRKKFEKIKTTNGANPFASGNPCVIETEN